MSDLATFLWAVAGILLGGAFTLLATRIQAAHGAAQAQRDRLLNLRTDSYRRLWSLTKELQRTPALDRLTKEALEDLVEKLDAWYFDDGGIYLSERCRTAYFDLLRAVTGAASSTPLRTDRYSELYRHASLLRANLAREIDTRQANKAFAGTRSV